MMDWNVVAGCVALFAGVIAFLAVVELFTISKRLTEIRDELRARRPGEAGEQLLKMTRPIPKMDRGPDVDYED
jgi:hypothetical protein